MSPRILIAGIGNIFLGDDAFGVEVVRRLLSRQWPDGVSVADFGIRGLDLAYALLDNPDVAVLIDAAPRGDQAGTLYVIEPELHAAADDCEKETPIEAHSMNPANVLRLAVQMGAQPGRVIVVGCEPGALPAEDEIMVEMSAPVAAAVDPAARLVVDIVEQLLDGEEAPVGGSRPA
jgi:hydrogenase maturation protease